MSFFIPPTADFDWIFRENIFGHRLASLRARSRARSPLMISAGCAAQGSSCKKLIFFCCCKKITFRHVLVEVARGSQVLDPKLEDFEVYLTEWEVFLDWIDYSYIFREWHFRLRHQRSFTLVICLIYMAFLNSTTFRWWKGLLTR